MSDQSEGTLAVTEMKPRLDVAKLAFPHLPATVSATSCSTLTRSASDLQSSVTEKHEKDSYGWFVEMEDESETASGVTSAYPVSDFFGDLAFVAPTASKQTAHVDEVEWAKAADTVDDVLGDFF